MDSGSLVMPGKTDDSGGSNGFFAGWVKIVLWNTPKKTKKPVGQTGFYWWGIAQVGRLRPTGVSIVTTATSDRLRGWGYLKNSCSSTD